jgi:signal transduction histidine kinase
MAKAKSAPRGDTDGRSVRELKLTCMANLLSTTEERVYFKDLESRFLFVSAGFIAAYAPGRSAEELTGKTDFDVFSYQHAADAFADEQEIIQTGKPIAGQVERETYTGRPDAWVSTTKMPLLDEAGQIIGTFGISRDVTAQVSADNMLARQASELSAQNERLRELDRLKDEFIAAVSHELRTPLTSIIGHIELLKEEGVDGPNTGRFAEVIGRNAEQLLRLVGDLLFLSRMRSGKLALELQGIDLAEIAAEAVAEVRPDARLKHIDMVLFAAPVPPFAADPGRIAQLLGSLLSNAVKFTGDGGRVEVRTAVADGQAVLTVADTGMGIPAADLERIFERFYRTAAATRQVITGTGLGLAIARAIADAHNGAITAQSTEGQGSTFTVRLPLRPVPAAQADAAGQAAIPGQ